MDSDVSAESDVKSDRSDQPSSPDVNSDDDSSSAGSSPAARRTSSPESSPAPRRTSSPESSPAARKTSSAESSPAPARTSSAESSPARQRTSSAESSPAPRKVSSRDSSPDAKDMSSEKESSPDTRAPSRRTGRDSWAANSDGQESGDQDAEVKINSRGQALSPVNSDSQESVDDELDTKITSPGQESVNDEMDTKITSPGRGSSPANSDGQVSADDEIDTKITSPGRGSSPANSDGQDSMDDEEHAKITSPDRESFVANSDDQESVDDEAKITSPGRESSSDVKDGYLPRTDPVDSGHELSPNVEHERVSDRELSPEPERESSPDTKSYHKYSSRSPDDGLYERINGNVSPKRSNSFVSDDHSDIASLDSVSPTQFEQHEMKPDYDDQEIEEDSDKILTKKKTIIDFADDLSDVSDIESNDSFSGQDKDMEMDKDEVEIDRKVEKPVEEEQEKIEPVKENEVIHDQTNGEVIDDKHDDAVSIHMDGEEQLDFEAEEGEVSPKPEKKTLKGDEPKKEKSLSDLEEGELTDDADTKPEETERPVCRFFSRGHCTWGSNCRFIHPGVMDKGNYSMFDTVRPIVTPGGPPPPNAGGPVMYPGFPPHIIPPHLAPERAGMIPPGGPRKDESGSESAWERGLRQAKEMIRKSTKRKETEVDFEDKKMNLTLSQDEIDKENDYYSRHSGSPPNKSPDLAEKWKMEADAKAHRTEGYPGDGPVAGSHGNEVPPLGYYPSLHHRPDYWNHHHRMGGLPYEDYGLRGPPVPYGPDYYAQAGRRYMHANSYYPPRPGVGPPASHHADFYDRKQKHKPYPGSSREVIVQKNDKPYKDERYRGRREESPRLDRGRDDEWADPWMRTKSPASGRRRRRRKNTYSSGSSYSSSSGSSRSSSRSSLSSRSHQSRSRSKGRSSGSGTQSSSRSAPETQTGKKPPMQFKLSPSSRTQLAGSKKTPKIISPSVMMDRRALNERPMHMNPPPPSPKVKTRPHSPPTGLAVSTNSPLKAKSGLPERLLAHSKAAVAAAMRSTRSTDSRSSKSSSGSSSSDSSSDSSDSSASSSSSSKSSKTPPVRVPKRIVPDDHSATSQTVKAKAMDALKLSGQKQQIKLTLKGSTASKRAVPDNIETRKERAAVVGKKRIAESSDSNSDSDTPAKKSKINQKRGVPSRREELLKQLRAVEDAIARKRSKNL